MKFLLHFLITFTILAASASDLPVLSNKADKHATLTREELQNFYLFRQASWDDGSPVVIISFPLTHPVHEAFLKEYIGIGPSAYMRRYKTLVSSGKASQTVIVTTMDEMLKVLSTTEGAIGYGDASFFFNKNDEVAEVTLR